MNGSSSISRKNLIIVLSDIRFWILLFFIIRLFGITNPPLEIGHNWRQTQTSMIARNFYEGGLDLLHPKIDMAGDKTGIIGSEFPFFNFIIYLFSMVFGYAHWYGRLINLVASSLGIWCFYLMINKLINRSVAFNATIILLSSIWFAYSRKIMPDTFSVALVIIGLYFVTEYFSSGGLIKLFLFFLFITLGGLCKIPALTISSLLIIPVFIKQIPLSRKLIVFSVTIIGFLIVILWYFYWVPHLVSEYKFPIIFPKSFMEGLNDLYQLRIKTLERFYYSSLHSFLAFGCFIAGLAVMFIRNDIFLKMAVTIVTLSFFLFIIKAGSFFSNHSYYIIAYTPLMALVSGFFISTIKWKYRWLLLVLITIEGIANQQHDFFIRDSELYKLTLEQIADSHIGKNELIVINGGDSPQQIYFANRKGWSVENEAIVNNAKMDELRQRGAAYLIVNKTSFNKDLDFLQIYVDSHFVIYELEKY
jgi:hypothetical protein